MSCTCRSIFNPLYCFRINLAVIRESRIGLICVWRYSHYFLNKLINNRNAFLKLIGILSNVSELLNLESEKNLILPSSENIPTPLQGNTVGIGGPFNIVTESSITP